MLLPDVYFHDLFILTNNLCISTLAVHTSKHSAKSKDGLLCFVTFILFKNKLLGVKLLALWKYVENSFKNMFLSLNMASVNFFLLLPPLACSDF